MGRQRFDIESVRQAIAVIEKFNSLNLEQVDLYENGEKLPITVNVLREWRFVGMSNTSFINLNYWKQDNES